jgi:glycosyltransferase involved in cell wall biosynthesis
MDPPMDGVTFLGRLTDAELAALYKASLAVVVASIEEGFGLSIIEAMGFGTAVITSNFPPMSEVGGVAAVLVDPHDVAALENAMRRIASEPEHREALIKRGHERFQAFSTTRFAASLSSVYRAQR